ncbi:hypothetical protein [Algoriphagus aquimarinus]|uniref:Lipocalin-like domain-containing protein n=1 Tax=Algoriphagus aquimarinus TaxID=237018 RepID=A0A1I1B403_9BACT|nr:hypothetical protein [Algoriphagus aquimarinus]SFB43458.1 hypothetical protein SAMN04489723_11053 [Algoriphagus aquimarinus]
MRAILNILFFLLIISSCSEDGQLEQKFQEGTFTGTFQRDLGDSRIANITLTFDGNHWSGTGDYPKYPALCRGTYSINGNKITFQNECAWTAEFDWTLILSGEYKLTKTGSVLEFSRDYRSATSDTYIDQYRLTKN